MDGELIPAWLSDRDRPWLRDLLHEAAALAGRPFAELAQRWRQAPPDPRAGARLAPAQYVLLELLRRSATAPPVSAWRQRLFLAAAGGAEPAAAIAAIAAQERLSPARIHEQLFADLPARRTLVWPGLEPANVALAVNLALAQGLLLHATRARLRLRGGSRAVLRTAWLHGAGLVVRTLCDGDVVLDWRPKADVRRLARRLCSLLPLLPWARQFELRADCVLPAARGRLVLATGDPLLPGPEAKVFDSGLERAFARDFVALAPGWELLREPAPFRVGDQLAFPDFGLRAPGATASWWVEIAGLRDPAMLPAKLALLAASPRLLLCLPRRLLPAAVELHPRVLPFRRRVDVGAVLARLATLGYPAGS